MARLQTGDLIGGPDGIMGRLMQEFIQVSPEGEMEAHLEEGDPQSFQTVIMEWRTYEFGYAFELTPGQPVYPHMEHHIFSRSLRFDDVHRQVPVHEPEADRIQKI